MRHENGNSPHEAEKQPDISDEEFRAGLIEIGKQSLPSGWVDTWADQLVQTVPMEARASFLNNELEPTDMVSSLSDEEIEAGL